MRTRLYLMIFACLGLILAGCGILPASGGAGSGAQPAPTSVVPSLTPVPSVTVTVTAESWPTAIVGIGSGPAASTPLAGAGMPLPVPTLGEPQAVTLNDNGNTVQLKVGDSFLLNLGEFYNWDITVSDPAVLSRVVNIAVIKGAQGVYAAHQAGTVILTATGDPQCRSSKPVCGVPSILFKITINVAS